VSVLVIATDSDEHAVAVAAEVRGAGAEVEILDLSAFPARARVVMRYACCSDCRTFCFEREEGRLDLERVGAVWWRRPQQPTISRAITRPTHRAFATNEAQEALAGLWHALDCFWINDPARDGVAHRKAYQLRVAQAVGLRIPKTLITNDVGEARAFVDALAYRNVVYKAFGALEEDWRETRILRPEEIGLLGHVQYAPVIFQEYVPALYDLRVTVVGDQIFPAAIHSQETSYPVDFRMDMGRARIEAVTLPPSVEDPLRALMQRLGLVYGAIDMRRTPEDEYVFLEINPAGQFLFVEQVSRQPIAAALARLLVEQDRARF
jgi:glutathione synthase/RimK-type ligase-like ATP-grasp enzyme